MLYMMYTSLCCTVSGQIVACYFVARLINHIHLYTSIYRCWNTPEWCDLH